jgi:hypothetical protein
MAKKRTGLQSDIAGIFSGVPVPKKGGQRSQSGGPSPKPEGPAAKPDKPASKTGGLVMPKPAVPKPMTPAVPTPQKLMDPSTSALQPKVTEVKVPEQKTGLAPPKITRRRKDKLFAPKAGVSSSRQKAGIITFILLSVVLVIVLARPYLTSNRNPDTSEPTGSTNTGDSAMAKIKIDWPIPSVYSAGPRDPMELGSQGQVWVDTSGGVMVRGISYSEDRKFAVVGIHTVQEGDIVPGTKIRVKRINLNSVEFEEDGKTWVQQVEGRRK